MVGTYARALRGKENHSPFSIHRPVLFGRLLPRHTRQCTCGITPYDATHIGHANTYVAFDMINRVWRDAGHQVRYVQNVTDIDDPLLERAVATGENWREIADRETALFRDDMAGLNVLPPDHYIGAVESIPSVARKVMQLQESGDVYAVGDDLYFRVRNDERFGSIAGLDEDDMVAVFAERGGDPGRAGKEHPLDCLVWQNARPEEPAWDTPLGHGRPGWHIECAAIALDYLGPTIDIQEGAQILHFLTTKWGIRGASIDRRMAVCAALRALRDGRVAGTQDEQVPRQFGLRLAVGPRGNRPDGDTASAARPPLSNGLGLDAART